jgi:fermentation-respiration switch protein FrsA (DUF1100 family)
MKPLTVDSPRIKNIVTGCVFLSVLMLMSMACNSAESSTPSQAITTPITTRTLPATATVQPSRTALPSQTPTASATPTVTLTPTATPIPHAMSIPLAREKTYPGSQITIEQTLEPGANYNRYIAWYESDGLKIYGLLTVPFGEMPENGWPAIVFNHGYIAPVAYRTTQRYISYVDQLARSGYIVYKIDYRGHDRSDGIARGAYGDPGYTTDTLNAVASLQAFSQADPDRIGMWGHSMGGFITLRAMVISSQIKAGVIWSGVVGSYPDLLCCWHHIPPRDPTRSPDPDYQVRWRDEWQNIYGTPAENPDFWNQISANSYLQDLSGPLQIHHDSEDSEVPVKYSQDLYQQVLISASPYPVEYYEYPGNDHDIANYFNLAMKRTIEFFDKYLKGSE